MLNIELWEAKKKELGLTFDELSEKSGIPKRTILGVFRKEVTTPRIDTVQAIERALGLSEEGYKDTMPFEVTPTEEELITKYRSLSEENKQLILLLTEKIK